MLKEAGLLSVPSLVQLDIDRSPEFIIFRRPGTDNKFLQCIQPVKVESRTCVNSLISHPVPQVYYRRYALESVVYAKDSMSMTMACVLYDRRRVPSVQGTPWFPLCRARKDTGRSRAEGEKQRTINSKNMSGSSAEGRGCKDEGGMESKRGDKTNVFYHQLSITISSSSQCILISSPQVQFEQKCTQFSFGSLSRAAQTAGILSLSLGRAVLRAKILDATSFMLLMTWSP